MSAMPKRRRAAFTPLQHPEADGAGIVRTRHAIPTVKRPEGRAPETAALAGRKKAIGHRSSAIGNPAQPPAALGHDSQNTSSPEGAEEGSELPKGWRRVVIKDMADSIQYGHTASAIQRKDGPRFLRITDIQDGRVDWNAVPSCDIPKADIPKYRLASGDLVFARTGATTGKSFLIGDCPEAVFASYLIRVRVSPGVDSRYLSAFFQSPDYWRQIEGGKRGIGQPNVNGQVLGEVQFPIAPLPEQRRIVAEIEKQFTRLEAGVAALRRVQANLKRYRAAVLKAACEGSLVPTEAELSKVAAASRRSSTQKQSRDGSAPFESGETLLARILTERRQNWQGRGKYKEPAAPDTGKLLPLPEGWAWASAEQLTSLVTSGSRGWGEFYSDAGPLFIRAQDIKTDSLKQDGVARVTLPAKAESMRSSVENGDLLITITGANVTKSGIVHGLSELAFVSQHVALLKPVCREAASFHFFWIVSPAHGRKLLEKWAYGAGKPGLSFEQVRSLPIALPPLAEQTRIVAEVERRLSVVEELESVVSANLQRAVRLRQSILQKAFTGQLV